MRHLSRRRGLVSSISGFDFACMGGKLLGYLEESTLYSQIYLSWAILPFAYSRGRRYYQVVYNESICDIACLNLKNRPVFSLPAPASTYGASQQLTGAEPDCIKLDYSINLLSSALPTCNFDQGNLKQAQLLDTLPNRHL